MATKRTKHRKGPFVVEQMQIDLTDFAPSDINAVREGLEGSTPLGRVYNLRRLASKFGIESEHLDKANSLIDDQGSINSGADMNRFDLALSYAQIEIERAAYDKIAMTPMIAYKEGQRTRAKKQRSPIPDLVRVLSKQEGTAKELWPELFSLMDNDRLEPEEVGGNGQPEYKYLDDKGRERSIKFSYFQTLLSRKTK